MTIKLIETRRKVQTSLAKMLETDLAIGGILGLEDGTLAVPGVTNHVWVRIEGSRYSVYNNRVAHLAGVPVLVGYEDHNPDLLQVLDYDYHSAPTATFPPRVPPHAWTHLFYGGSDPVFIYLRAFLPLCPGITDSLEVTIWPGMYLTPDGWVWVESTPVDLSSYVPTTLGYRYVLIYVDVGGVIQTIQGSVKSDLDLGDIPELPIDCFAVCAVRLYKYQSYIIDTATESDLIDLRFPQVLGTHTHEPSDIDLSLGELNDVELSSLTDQDVIRYEEVSELWKNVPLVEAVGEVIGQSHIHASFETYGNGAKRIFILPNIYEPITTEVFVNGLRQRFEIEWIEYSDDEIKFGEAPLQDDLIIVNYVPETEAVVT